MCADCKDAAEIEAMHKQMTPTDVAKWKRDRMHLCEPVECYGCNAVSVNGGIVYCSTCVSTLRAENERLRADGCACGHHAPHDVQGEGNITMFFCSVDGCGCLAPKREREAMLSLVWHRNKLAQTTTDRERIAEEGRKHAAKWRDTYKCERDAALAELATLREQADTIPPPKRRATRRSN